MCRMIPLVLTAVFLAPAIAPGTASASQDGGDSTPTVQAARTAEAPHIDGQLDEAAWEQAVPVTSFTQIEPEEGAPATERTEARILFDDVALYIGVRMDDRHPVTSRLGRRDMPIAGDSDWFRIVLDSNHDRHTGFVFDVNPAGVKRDAIKTVTQEDGSWDPVWEAATTVDADGWSVEIRIPFSQLRFSAEEHQTWGIQLERLIARSGEYVASTFIPRDRQGGVPEYGTLTGIEGIRAGRSFEVTPYALTRARAVPESASAYDATFGLDLQYRVTSELTLTATLNPDFGQVELDPAVINLTAFETFFPEKRPFFVQDAGIFSFAGEAVGPGAMASNLFYSRRIGRQPQVPVAGAQAPEATRILGAAKLAGRTAGGWSLGVMEAATRPEWVPAPGSDAGEVLAEPFTNYFVGRVGRDLRDGQTAVGGMMTAVHRDLATEPAADRLASAAYAGGLDFRHEWGARAWSVSGFLSGSHVQGSTGAIGRLQAAPARYFHRPDASHLEPDAEARSLSGVAGQIQLRRQAGRHWRGDMGLFAVSPGYEVNDLGYIARTDLRGANAQVTYQQTRPGDLLRSYSLVAQGIYAENFDGDHIDNALLAGGMWRLQNFWSGALNARYAFPRLHDRLTRGGPLAAQPAEWLVAGQLDSDPRKSLSGGGFAQFRADRSGGNTLLARTWLTARPSPRWTLAAGPMVQRVHSTAHYLAAIPDAEADLTYGRRYLFAELDQTTLALETRLDFTVTPALTLEVFAQPFLSSVAFGEARSLVAPRTYEFEEFEGAEAMPDPSFNLRSLRGNAVLRWEWRPGSTLYLAWQQRREDVAPGVRNFDLSRDQSALFRAAPENVLMLKVSHWLNF
jgi:hypothetical protein